MTYTLPQLPYDFNELEPVISAELLSIHYSKHHQAYVNNLNKAVQDYHEAEITGNLSRMIILNNLITFNGGGHINHTLFWENLISEKKGGGALPPGILAEQINKDFGSLNALVEEFNAKAVAVQGSGWGWLCYNKARKHLEITTTESHILAESKGLAPLLIVDVWEHAYYLQYKNVRGDFLKNIWRIINWKKAEERFQNIV